MRWWFALVALTSCTGVRGEYRCTADPQCVVDGVQGVCESSGYCAYSDGECPGTARRYGDNAGELSGRCVDADGLDADASIGPTDRCGSPGVLVDSFDDQALAPFWIPVGGGGSVVDGALRIAPPSDVNAVVGYVSGAWVDLREGAASVRTQISTADGVLTQFTLVNDKDRVMLRFVQVGTQLTAELHRNTELVSAHADTYEPTEQRVWRISEHAGTVSFEVSPDGSAWTTFFEAPAPGPVNVLRIALTLEVAGFPAPGSASFDELNAAVPRADWCPASELSDDFDNGVIDLAWADVGSTSPARCTPDEADGMARLTLGGQAVTCWIASGQAYDLTNGEIAVEWSPSALPPTVSVELAAVDAAGASLSLLLKAGTLTARGIDAGGTEIFASTPDLIGDDTHWRIVHAAGMLQFQTGDGTSWTDRHQAPVPPGIDIEGLRVYLRASSEADPATVMFARYN